MWRKLHVAQLVEQNPALSFVPRNRVSAFRGDRLRILRLTNAGSHTWEQFGLPIPGEQAKKFHYLVALRNKPVYLAAVAASVVISSRGVEGNYILTHGSSVRSRP